MSEQEAPGGAEAAYEWTVRILYAVLIVGNLALAYEAWATTASGIEWRAKVRGRVEAYRAKMKDCEPCAKRKAWMRDRAHMLWQAQTIVEEAQTGEAAE